MKCYIPLITAKDAKFGVVMAVFQPAHDADPKPGQLFFPVFFGKEAAAAYLDILGNIDGDREWNMLELDMNLFEMDREDNPEAATEE